MKLSDHIAYLRVSLLSGCNLHCSYCRPAGILLRQPVTVADYDQLTRSIALLAGMGIRKIRFTGGEPTLYKRLPDTIRFAKNQSQTLETRLTTNGLLLAGLAKKLAASGLDSVNISLDTLDRERFRSIAGLDGLDKVLDGITAARDHISSVKLNCVVMRGVNDGEIGNLISFAHDLRADIRFIEFMPTSSRSRDDSRYLSSESIRSNLPYALIPAHTPLHSAARYYTTPELNIRVGFISPVSHPFCHSCNRIRLTSDGFLHSCLFSRESVDLFSLLAHGRDSAQEAIHHLVAAKQFLGCSAATAPNYTQPNFMVMGG